MTDTRAMSIEQVEPLLAVTSSPVLDGRCDAKRDSDLVGKSSEGLAQLLGNDGLPAGGLDVVLNGKWAPSGRPGLYLLRESIPRPATAFAKTSAGSQSSGETVRWSVIGALDPGSETRFVPAVSASRVDVDETARHVRLAGVDPGGVIALYRDEELRIERLVETREGIPPLAEYATAEGNFHLWCLSAEESQAAISVLTECGGIVVGDVSLYRAIQRLRDDRLIAPTQRPLVRFYNQRDFSVSFSATTRIYSEPQSFDPNRVVQILHSFAQVEEIELGDPAQLSPIVDQLRSEAISQRVTAMFRRESRTVYILRVPLDGVSLVGHENPPEVATEFDVEWIEKGLLRRLFPDRSLTASEVFVDANQGYRAVQSGQAEFGFLVNPPPKRALVETRESGWRLPRHALMLRPGAPRGLIMAALSPRAV